ncbi:sodium/calcium exchanger protein [Salinirarus marinus]|uniref:sodium/calcium exchanger protein n=1 Tax=Salinirarus marinus TaxID=3068310 RepID=UPI003C6CA416
MRERLGHPLSALFFAFLLTGPWVYIELTGGPSAYGLSHLGTVAVSGVAVLGASFLLAWGAETAEKDVPRAFAIAVLAVLAVAPEYAVDALYAWTAGANVGTPRGAEAANLAVANMTGANRILIGLGWSGIAIFTVYQAKRTRDPAVETRDGWLADRVHIDRSLALEIVFLLAATAYALAVPLGGGIGILDTVVLVGLYVVYIGVILRGDVEEHEEHVGVPAYLQEFARRHRVAITLFLFAFSGAMIYTAVHPFAHGLEELGQAAGVPPFFMIQWIAPLASESPELIVVAYLVNKARSTAGFNALISSKLNQWTLLIGTLAVVYSLAAGQVGTLPFDHKQSAEIWITAAQSFFAIAILTNFSISVREAVALLGLFVSQVAIEYAIIQTVADPARAEHLSILVLDGYTVVYLVLGAVLFVARRDELRGIVRTTATTIQDAFTASDPAVDQAD